MSISVSASFSKHFQTEVHNAFQRMGSKLRNTVRSKNNIRGSSTTFQKIGKGTASTKARHGKVPVMNIDHQPVEVTLQDYYAGDWVDSLDELKSNIDERQITANAGAYALGRKTDDLIIDKLTNLPDKQNATGSRNSLANNKGLTKEKILLAFEMMGEAEVPDDGQRFAIIGWRQWGELLEIEEFANADYVGDDALPWKGTQAKRWLGSLWMPHSGLIKDSENIRDCYWYHKSAIGHASGCDIKSDITYHGDRASHFINNMMSQGANIIDDSGIIRIRCKEA